MVTTPYPIHEIRCYKHNMEILWKVKGGETTPRQKYSGARAAVDTIAEDPRHKEKQNRVTTHIAFVETEQTRIATCGSCCVVIMDVKTGCTLATLFVDSGQPVHRICPTPRRVGNHEGGGNLFTLSYAGMVDFWTYDSEDRWTVDTPTDADGRPILHTPFAPNPAPVYNDGHADLRSHSHAYTFTNFPHFDFEIVMNAGLLQLRNPERHRRFVSTQCMHMPSRPPKIPADLVSDLHGRSLISVYDDSTSWRQLTRAGVACWEKPEQAQRRKQKPCAEKKIFKARQAL